MKAIRKLILYILIAIFAWIYFTTQNGKVPPIPQAPNDAPIVQIPQSTPSAQLDPSKFAKGSVDYIFVDKSAHFMELYAQGEIVARYDIALGFAPVGNKQMEGDGKTPEGEYSIDYRNPKSSFHRSLHISYPRPDQIKAAKAAGRKPGGMIMIHGQINGREWQGDKKIMADWTNGCISVSNNEIEEIWRLVRDGAKIKIVK